MFKLLVSYTIFFVLVQINCEASKLTEKQKINYLLQKVRKSNALFYKNGETINAAQTYLNLKLIAQKSKSTLPFLKSKKPTVKNFLSELSKDGRSSYYVLPEAGQKIEINQWLNQRLVELQQVPDSQFSSNNN